MSRELNILACPLSGRVLLEASAGTGKTWSICALILRLVLEKHLEIREILVLTFTRAATAELKTRVRARLEEAFRHISDAPSNDPLLTALFARLEDDGHSAPEMAARLKRALSTFDEAAIFTLHGFCKRVLADLPLLSHQPLAMNFSEEGEACSRLLGDVAADFWRRRVMFGDESPLFLRYLNERKFSRENLVRLGLRHSQRPLAEARWPEDSRAFSVQVAALSPSPPSPLPQGERGAKPDTPSQECIHLDHNRSKAGVPDESALQTAFTTARAIWQREEENIFSLLGEKIEAKSLHATYYKAEKLPLWQAEWRRYFAADLPESGFAAMQCFSSSYLVAKSKKGHAPPEHPFFAAIDELCECLAACQQFCEARLIALQRAFVEFFPAALAEAKRRGRHLDFNDMLLNVHQALKEESGKALAKQLRQSYPAALIDEFQDTDPLQYAIFQAIYPPPAREFSSQAATLPPSPLAGEGAPKGRERGATSALFFVGDPKQAIYSFRQADLPTYFAARKTVAAEQTFSLSHNQRSSEGVLAGINAIFSAHGTPFMLDELHFPEATRGEKPLPSFVDESEVERSAFTFWQPPEAEEKKAALWAAEITAAEIARLLAATRAKKIRVNDEPLPARRIAVLVRTNKEGKLIRQALAAVGVRAVELSLASVYKSRIAAELAPVLAAMLFPRDSRRIKAALATSLFAFSAPKLDAMDDSSLAGHISRFAHLNRLWQEKGILAALAALDDGKLSSRLLKLPDGERHLTDYLHLQELLHGEERGEKLSPERLFEAFLLALANPPGGEATQIRLESGRDLVRIVTIHKAKGLEYDIVFCPFLWKKHKPPASKMPGEIYHEDSGTLVIDYRPEMATSGKQLAQQEEAREALRLIYVALTRAVLRCYLISNPSPGNSLLNWLAAGGEHTPWLGKDKLPDETAIRAAWERVADAAGSQVETPTFPEEIKADAAFSSPPIVLPPSFPGRALSLGWRMESFSGLVRGASWSGEEKEHDAASATEKSSPLPESGEEFLAEHDILHFPRGARAGDCIHAFFELIEFTNPATFAPAAARALALHPQAGETAKERARLEAQLLNLAENVMATPLPLFGETPLRLGELLPAQRLSELAFHLPTQQLDPARLGKIMAAAGEPLPDLAAPLLRGYLKGFVDLVFAHEGRYYILDWKSNHLGWQQADYAASRLVPAMEQHGYFLQARLYLLALHRYLRTRLPDYDPARHLGGACYLFVRGLRPEWKSEGLPAGFYGLAPNLPLLFALESVLQTAI